MDHQLELLPRLASVDNFRDLAGTGAGYPTADGGRMRRGVLYRANRLELSPADLATLGALGLTAIHDLRDDYEIAHHSDTAVPGAVWQHHRVPGIPQAEVYALETAEQMYAAMIENYRTFVADPTCRAGFSTLLHAIAADPGPQLFHCAAGKDRTGWAAVLLHHIAGVDAETIRADYALTDEYAVTSRQATLDSILEALGEARVPAYEPAFRCSQEYLDAAFDEVDRRYGGVDGYLDEGLGVTAGERAELRARLVVGP